MFLKGAKQLSFRLLMLLHNALFRCFGFSRLEKQCRNSLLGSQFYTNVGRWLCGRYDFHSSLYPQDGEFLHWSGRLTGVAFLTGSTSLCSPQEWVQHTSPKAGACLHTQVT